MSACGSAWARSSPSARVCSSWPTKAWLFDFVVDRANKNPALADTISSMFTDLDLRERSSAPASIGP
jgi:esterase/lipase superfamily enzyme